MVKFLCISVIGSPDDPAELENKLRRDLQTSREAALEPSTKKNLEIQWFNFTNFSKRLGKPPYPISLDTLCLYAQYLTSQVKSPTTIRNYISGICTIIHVKGGNAPNLSSPIFKLTMKGITKVMQHRIKQAKPITPRILSDIYNILDHSNSFHIALWAALLLGFLLLLRKSNLVPDSRSKIDPKKLIMGEKLTLTPEAAIVSLTWTKTHQTGAHIIQVPLLKIPGSVLCPIKAIEAIEQTIGIKQGHPLFRYLDKRGQPKTLTYPQLNGAIKQLVSSTGRDGSKFTSHSLRRGGANFAFKIGLPGEHIQALGNWASDAYKVYIDNPLETRTRAAAKIKKSLKKQNY